MLRWVLTGILELAVCAAAQAQSPGIPRTPDGHPDFQGIWRNYGATKLERPANLQTLVLEPELAKREAAAALASVQTGATPNPDIVAMTELPFSTVAGEIRSSWITSPADGRLPLTAEARRIIAASQSNFDGPDSRSTEEQCVTGPGVTPLGGQVGAGFYQIVQTPNHLAIFIETAGLLRIAGFNAKPRPAETALLFGDSIARWDGNTLVVETTHVAWRPLWPDRRRPPLLRPEARLIERFSYLSADELLYQFTIEDSVIYSQPWSAEYSLTRSTQRVYEYACHEGNYGLYNLLSGTRETERRAAKQEAPKTKSEP